MSDDRSARVREHAYRLWQQEGEPHGRDRDHWEQAEREIGDDDAPVTDAPISQNAAPDGDTAPDASPGDRPAAPEPSEPTAAADKAPAAKKPAMRRKRPG